MVTFHSHSNKSLRRNPTINSWKKNIWMDIFYKFQPMLGLHARPINGEWFAITNCLVIALPLANYLVSGIGEPRSNFSLIYCSHFRTNTLVTKMSPSLHPELRLKMLAWLEFLILGGNKRELWTLNFGEGNRKPPHYLSKKAWQFTDNIGKVICKEPW